MPVTKSKPLIGVFALLVLAAVVIVFLVLLFPGRQHLPSGSSGEYDAASMAYLKALLKAKPDDQAARLALTRQYLAKRDLSGAQKAFAPLLQLKPQPASVLAVKLLLEQALLAATEPGSALYEARLQRLHDDLLHFEQSKDVTADDLETAARGFLSMNAPAYAAQLYQKLAAVDSLRRYHWLSLAGKWWLAADRPGHAARAWLEAIHNARSTDEARTAGEQALRAELMANGGRGQAALDAVRQAVAVNPKSVELLDQAVGIALANKRPDLAMKWARRALELQPNDLGALQRYGSVALAAGDLEASQQAYEKLVEAQPDNADFHRQLGEILIWNKQPLKGIAQLEIVARMQPGDAIDERIIEAGRSVHALEAVTAALGRVNQRHRLSPQRMTLYIDTLTEFLGQPLKAITILKHWLDASAQDKPLWFHLAKLYRQTDQLPTALATLRHMETLYGFGVDMVDAEVRLQVEMWHLADALRTIQRFVSQQRRPITNAAFWLKYANIAWSQDKLDDVIRAYGWLFDHERKKLTTTGGQRLLQALLLKGQMERASTVAIALWQQTHDPSLLVSAIDGANNHNRHDLTDELFAQAQMDPEAFADLPYYWQLHGFHEQQAGHNTRARSDYLHALQLSPDDAEIQSAFLYLLIDQHDTAALRRYLPRWQDEAGENETLWSAYAQGYTQLGQPQQALYWFAKRAHARPRDYLWLLDYADALDAVHRFADAQRVRRYAIARLRPELLKKLRPTLKNAQERQDALRAINAQQAMIGSDEALRWLRRAFATKNIDSLDKPDFDLLVDWYLAAREPAYARFWLLRAQMRRLRSPAYQRLSAALQANDHMRIAEVIDHSQQPGLSERVAGLQRIGRHADAQLLALNHINDRTPWAPGIDELPRYAAGEYRRMPQYASAGYQYTGLGDLQVSTGLATLKRSTKHWTVTARVGRVQLRSTDSKLALDGIDTETIGGVSLEHRGRRNTTTVSVGRVSTAVAGYTDASLEDSHRFTDRLNGTLFLKYHQPSLDSSVLRATGNRDAYGFDLGYSPTVRDELSLTARMLRYHSLRGDALGRGFGLDGQFSHALLIGQTYQLSARLEASFLHNHVDPVLPAYLAARLPSTATAQTVVPEKYGFVGTGFTVSRGQPGSEYPLVGGLRYQLSVDAGYVLPQGSLGLSVHAALSHRILGSDDLSLYFGTDHTQSVSSGTVNTVGLKYHYYFGK